MKNISKTRSAVLLDDASYIVNKDRNNIVIYAKEAEKLQAQALAKFSKNSSNVFLQKSHDFGSIFGSFNQMPLTSSSMALRFYAQGSPVKIAVDRIADQLETIPLVVKDKEGQEVQHPVLRLLNIPNAGSILAEFLKEISIHYSLTGNIFIIATGDINRPPLELFVVNPSQVTLTNSTRDMFPQEILVNTHNGQITFRRANNVSNPTRLRYTADGNKEIWHIKDFNPFAHRLIGMSPLQPLLLELEQYINASIHNNSLLKRGATISGIFSLEDSETLLDPEQQDMLRVQINAFYSGVENAGSAFLSSKIKFQPITQNNRDMDFGVLRSAVFDTIVTGLKVPLPLVTTESMTFNNLENAILLLYDQAVIPLAKRLFKELSLFLLPRYPNSEGLAITFVEGALPALQPRRNAELNKLNNLNVLTPNEMRALVGFDPLPSGGDFLYIPANLIPIGEGSDEPTQDVTTPSTTPAASETQPVATTPKSIKDIKDYNGHTLFIDKMALAYGKNITPDETTREQ